MSEPELAPSLSVDAARAAIAAAVQPITESQTLPLAMVLGRVLAADVDAAAGRADDVLLRAGHVLTPADLGLIASLGIPKVRVLRRLRVAVFSIGDELRSLGQPLPPGCAYESNRHSLLGALQRLGMDVIDLGLVQDDPVALRRALTDAVLEADALLTTGNIDQPGAANLHAALGGLGDVAFWNLALQPAPALAFGGLQEPGSNNVPIWFFGLPGDPLAALVAFYALARDGLRRLSGAQPPELPLLPVRSADVIAKQPGQSTILPVVLEADDQGRWQARVVLEQDARDRQSLRRLSRAHALLVLGPDRGPVAAGDSVDIWLLDGLY